MKHTPTQELPAAEPVNYDATWAEDFERQQKRSKAAKLGWITRRARQMAKPAGWWEGRIVCTPTGRYHAMLDPTHVLPYVSDEPG